MSSDPMKQINSKQLGEEFVVRRVVLKFEDAVRRAKRILSTVSMRSMAIPQARKLLFTTNGKSILEMVVGLITQATSATNSRRV